MEKINGVKCHGGMDFTNLGGFDLLKALKKVSLIGRLEVNPPSLFYFYCPNIELGPNKGCSWLLKLAGCPWKTFC